MPLTNAYYTCPMRSEERQRIEAGEGGDPCVEIPLSILEELGVECEGCYPGPDMGQVVINQMANVDNRATQAFKTLNYGL